VIVRLISGVDYRGTYRPVVFMLRLLTTFQFLGVLSCLDGYMNIALEQTEEQVNGAVTNRYGDAFIRGNNGAFV
jgi:U6 snRNA-associated Sm-like protein LSm6